jgi:hypothetical protein
MQASVTFEPNGHVALHLDAEATRAVFASIVFASRFHQGIAPLAAIAEQGLRTEAFVAEEGAPSCQ